MINDEPLPLDAPFENGSDRDERGRFRPGWKGGPGNPGSGQARQVRWRWDNALFKTCSEDRLLVAIDAALKAAEAGNIQALKFLAEYIKGPPINAELIERLEALEAAAAEAEK